MDTSMLISGSRPNNNKSRDSRGRGGSKLKRSGAVDVGSDHDDSAKLIGAQTFGHNTVDHSHMNGGPKSHDIPKPPKRDPDADEVDIVTDAMKPGASAKPLVLSLREEIEKLTLRLPKEQSSTTWILY